MAPPSGIITASLEYIDGKEVPKMEGTTKRGEGGVGKRQNGKPSANQQQQQKPLPTLEEVRAAVPTACFEKVLKINLYI
jgi:hypothetical protein